MKAKHEKKLKKSKGCPRGQHKDSTHKAAGSPPLKALRDPVNSALTEKNEKSKSLRTEISLQGDTTLKDLTFLILNKHPNMKPKALCKHLDLDYGYYGATMSSYRHEWKNSKSENRQGLNRLSWHGTKFFGYALKVFDRRQGNIDDLAVAHGWKRTRARNHMLVWVDSKRGRLEWFLSGRINGRLKKPANLGRLKQLLCNAFYPAFIPDISTWNKWAETFCLKGSHLVYDTGEILPYARIDLLKDSNGVIVTIGDKTHPTCVEIIFCYPDWAERNEIMLKQCEKALQQFSTFMADLTTPKRKSPAADRMVI